MTEEQMNIIWNFEKKEHLLCEEDFDNKEDRTLIYGYTCDRETFHVYFKNKKIRVIKYGGYKNIPLTEINPKTNQDFIPDKRVYPDASDYNFCLKLREFGYEIPFTSYKTFAKETFYAKIIEDFNIFEKEEV